MIFTHSLIRDLLKKNPIFLRILILYRRFQFTLQKKSLSKKFASINYPCIDFAKRTSNLDISKLNILWIGTDENQDNIGFIDELSSLASITVFTNHLGAKNLFFDRDNPSLSRELNKERLLYYVNNFNFNLVMGQFWPELINFCDINLQNQLRQKSIKSICIAMDDFMPNRWLPDSYARFAGPAGFGPSVDLYATSDLNSVTFYSKLGLKSIYLPFGCSVSLSKNFDRDIDISFVGSNYGIRKSIIDKLYKAGLKINVYGPGFENGKIGYEEIISIYNRSKIILGISQVGYQKNARNLKTRDFDSISSGALYVSNSCDEFNQFFSPGYHYIKYNDIDDLIFKLKFYLRNDKLRTSIAYSAQQYGLRNHLWRFRLSKIIHFAYE